MTLKERREKRNREGRSPVPSKEYIVKMSKIKCYKNSCTFDELIVRREKVLNHYNTYHFMPGLFTFDADAYKRSLDADKLLQRPVIREDVVKYIEYVESNHLENDVLDEIVEDSLTDFKQAVADGYYRPI